MPYAGAYGNENCCARILNGRTRRRREVGVVVQHAARSRLMPVANLYGSRRHVDGKTRQPKSHGA